MSQRSRFFDSEDGDRIYTSDAWAQVFGSAWSDGVVFGAGNELQVVETNPTGLIVEVGLGKAFVQGRYFEVFGGAEALEISTAHASLPRIDRVVIRVDYTGRDAILAVLTGTPASSPSAPVLTQDTGTWEFSLARVAVAAQATGIVQANITDERGARAKGPDLTETLDLTSGHTHDGSNSRGISFPNVTPLLVPVGTVIDWVGNTPPTGWLECDGTEISRSTYAELYSLVGDLFGPGNGTTTFNLPDLRNQFIRGASGTGGSGVGNPGGSTTHTHTQTSTASTGAHTHAADTTGSSTVSHSHSNPTIGSKDLGTHSHTTPTNTGSTSLGSHDHTTPSTSSTGSHAHDLGNSLGSSGSTIFSNDTSGSGASQAGHIHGLGSSFSAGNHSHTMGDTGNTSLGSHNHTMGSTNTSDLGSHTHTATAPGNESAGTGHTHSIPVSSSSGNHAHTNPTTDSTNHLPSYTRLRKLIRALSY